VDASAHPSAGPDSNLTGVPEPRLLADIAYEGLRDRLLTLQIRPGQSIDEERIGRELGIGRTPVREAIKRLSLEKLVNVYPRRGTFASDINITDLSDISDIRAALESHAAGRAAERLTPERRLELQALLAELDAVHASSQGDLADAERPALMDLDARVHRFIYRCADNPYLAETCERYFNLSLRIWYLALHRMPALFTHIDEHRALLQSISAGDAQRARRIVTEHVQTFERSIRDVL
jgi:DNA-binding GntR family transcriptional regulator